MPCKLTRNVFRLATLVSAVLLALTVVTLAVGLAGKLGEPRLALKDDFHIGITRSHPDPDVRLEFFNNREYGPYRGSIIGSVDAEGNLDPPLVKQSAWGDSLGIYWRYFRWNEGTWGLSNPVVWTLQVSLWYPIAVFSLLPATWWFLRRKRAYRGGTPASNAALPNAQ